MILRDDYIKRIKPFIGLEPVKVLTTRISSKLLQG